MNLRASIFLLIGACGGATADTPTPHEVEIPNNVPKSSSTAGVSDSSNTVQACVGEVDGYGCLGGQDVANVEDLLAIVQQLDSQPISVAKGTALDVSGDITAEADLEVSASNLAAQGCDGCQTPYFRARAFPQYEAIAGVRCIEEAPAQPVVRVEAACARIAIAKGTTFRLRSVVQDMHPSAPTYWPFVDFVAACTTECPSGEVYSSRSHQCFKSAYESCAYGEGLSPETCSCRADACHQKEDGAECHFASSPDVEESGTCGQRGCVRSR